jgi:hypothetical protein
MQFDREKLKAAILYTCRRCDADDLGAVKLHKVLYFSDMLRYIQAGRPITGSTYRKRPLGPTCDQLLSSLRELEVSGLLAIENVDYFGYYKKQYTALADPEPRLSGDEVAVLDEVVDFVCRPNTAKTISEFSHQSPWELAEFGDVLPYTSAFRLLPTQVSEETMQWASEQEAMIERQRLSNQVAIVPFGAFRERVLERTRGK